MTEKEFSIRLAKLREQKGVSARDMSLSLGQNAGYISNIECGRSLPSMTLFFYICEYLEISPQDFFDKDTVYPAELNSLINDLKKLKASQLGSISSIVKDMIK